MASEAETNPGTLKLLSEQYVSNDEAQETVSFHLRPVYRSATPIRVLAATDRLLLLHDSKIGCSLARVNETDGLRPFMTFHKNVIPLYPPHIRFMSDSSLCYLTGIRATWDLVVVSAPSGSFEEGLKIRNYRIATNTERDIRSLDIGNDGQILISYVWEFHNSNLNQLFGQLTKANLHPESNSATLERMDTFSWPAEHKVHGIASNGRIFLGRTNHTGYRNTYETYARMEKRDHLIGRTQHHHFQAFPGGALCGERLRARISLDLLLEKSEGFDRIHYAGNIPLPDSVLDKADKKEFKFVKSGSSFFFVVNQIIFKGHLPGADVSLEEVGAARVWQGLPATVQISLLRGADFSNRAILLAAMEERTEETLPKKKKAKKRKAEPEATLDERVVAGRYGLRRQKPISARFSPSREVQCGQNQTGYRFAALKAGI